MSLDAGGMCGRVYSGSPPCRCETWVVCITLYSAHARPPVMRPLGRPSINCTSDTNRVPLANTRQPARRRVARAG